MHDEKKEDPPSTVGVGTTPEGNSVATRKGIMKLVIDHFSSTPIDPEAAPKTSEEFRSEKGASAGNSIDSNSLTTMLTESERDYLHRLVKAGDMSSIEAASERLSDPSLFPEIIDVGDDDVAEEDTDLDHAKQQRRDSRIQQHLFRLHETQAVKPSRVLKRMSLVHRNSILEDDGVTSSERSSTKLSEGAIDPDTIEDSSPDSAAPVDWDPFKDITKWIDGSEGVEVNDDGEPITEPGRALSSNKGPFKILGTSADDVSCHPHVLSPPLMESLLAFVPESLSGSNFWLKYSLVRDGASFWKLLRHVRASNNCFLAIETVDGQVLGSFTNQAWRLSQGWYGSNEAFLFKLRHSRLHSKCPIVQQVYQESEVQVYPYRSGNVAVQNCSKEGIMLGQGELLPTTKEGNHYGHALYLERNLTRGSTSNSETFGNPCLVNAEQRGARFKIANLEVWTLTPHTTVEEAEKSELSTMFLEGGRAEKSLNFMNILVGGGPI